MEEKMAAVHKNAEGLRSLGRIKRIMGVHLPKHPALQVTGTYTSSTNRNMAVKRTDVRKSSRSGSHLHN